MLSPIHPTRSQNPRGTTKGITAPPPPNPAADTTSSGGSFLRLPRLRLLDPDTTLPSRRLVILVILFDIICAATCAALGYIIFILLCA
jgi:hypothetical protein